MAPTARYSSIQNVPVTIQQRRAAIGLPAFVVRYCFCMDGAASRAAGQTQSPLPLPPARDRTAHAIAYPNATSKIIIKTKPAMTPRVPTLECSPKCASGISSSTTTYSIAAGRKRQQPGHQRLDACPQPALSGRRKSARPHPRCSRIKTPRQAGSPSCRRGQGDGRPFGEVLDADADRQRHGAPRTGKDRCRAGTQAQRTARPPSPRGCCAASPQTPAAWSASRRRHAPSGLARARRAGEAAGCPSGSEIATPRIKPPAAGSQPIQPLAADASSMAGTSRRPHRRRDHHAGGKAQKHPLYRPR